MTPVVAVVGPTASGKSELAVALAERFGGEIVNADAMQLYRGMDIGTAKLPEAERRGVPHHLLDVLDVIEEASVAEYQRLAAAVIDEIEARSAVPMLVGGSSLYLRAALDDLDIPPTDPDVRARYQAELDRVGPEPLHRVLAARDPVAAAAILPGNGRRIVRALEVGELTGAPFRASLPAPHYRRRTLQLGLALPRESLDARIAARVEVMWRHGLVAEVEALLARGLLDGRTASRAIGYAQVVDLLRGTCDESEAKEAICVATRRLVRRQESWLRRDQRITWLDAADPEVLDAACRLVRSTLQA